MGKEKVLAEVDWAQYFADIKSVCPWAYRAMQQDKILVWEYAPTQVNTVVSIFAHSEYEALVFTCADKSSEWLTQYCDARNAEQDNLEWLWSHPEHGGDSTPTPCLIVQDARTLEDLRSKTGYYDEDAEED